MRSKNPAVRLPDLAENQIWAPDSRSPQFASEERRQSLAVSRSIHHAEDQEFIDAISEWPAE